MNKDSKNKKYTPWLMRIGLAGFLFFFLKGLVWLAVFYGVGSAINC